MADTSKNCYNFSFYSKFCDVEECSLTARDYPLAYCSYQEVRYGSMAGMATKHGLPKIRGSHVVRRGRMYLATKIFVNLDRFHNIRTATQYFRFWKSAIMDHFLTFCKMVYTQIHVCFHNQNCSLNAMVGVGLKHIREGHLIPDSHF